MKRRWGVEPRGAGRWAAGWGLWLCSVAWAGPPVTAGSPALNYKLICMGCHLEDGSGMPQRGIPSMKGVLGHFLRLPEGRALIVQVPGVMNTPLNDRQVADLMNWMMEHVAGDSVPPGAAPYTEAEVTHLRQSRPADVMQARTDVVRRLRAMGYQLN